MAFSLTELNRMNQAEFVNALGAIFENTPTIAAAAWSARPFTSVAVLHQIMVDVVHQLSLAEQLDLIRAHPDLGSKAKMAAASVQEQSSIGLDRLSPEEFDQLQSFNQAYKEKFGFPFIIAVKNHTKTSILAAFQTRLNHSIEAERQQALNQIFQIAWLRLVEQVSEP
jgi:2-oxo-4-hydroxy-4-carboxy-5-ureidoimidazoline decarboxylase